MAIASCGWEVQEVQRVAGRQAFEAALEARLQHEPGEHSPLSVVLVEIDFFAQLRAACGRDAADECQEAIAEAIADTVRRSCDLVATLGPGQFGVLLCDTDDVRARYVADEIWLQADALVLHHPRSPVSRYVTVTIGAATSVPGMAPGELIREAQAALSQAREQGRDQVALAARAGQTV